jgi:hypothetical protein
LQREESGAVLDADLAMIWFSLGEVDKGFYHLDQAAEKGMGAVAIIMEHYMFKVPKNDIRFARLKKKLRLEPVQQ